MTAKAYGNLLTNVEDAYGQKPKPMYKKEQTEKVHTKTELCSTRRLYGICTTMSQVSQGDEHEDGPIYGIGTTKPHISWSDEHEKTIIYELV